MCCLSPLLTFTSSLLDGPNLGVDWPVHKGYTIQNDTNDQSEAQNSSLQFVGDYELSRQFRQSLLLLLEVEGCLC